jgi:HNH endonuclease
MGLDPVLRSAIIEAHDWKCIICGKPIVDEFDIDHMIPEEMGQAGREDELATLCDRLGRPGFDIQSLRNLGPAHKPCNNNKGTHVFPDTILDLRLTAIEKKVRKVEWLAAKRFRSREIEKSMLTLIAAISAGETSATNVATRISSALPQTEPASTAPRRFSLAWTPAARSSLKAYRASIPKIEAALAFAAQGGRVSFLRERSRPDTWYLRFNINEEAWRAFAILDDGLLLITRVWPKLQGRSRKMP